MCLYLYTNKQKHKDKMETQNTNPAEETKTIELTYMEARALREMLEIQAKSQAEIAVDYLNFGSTRWAEVSAKKHRQTKAILSKIETIL